MVRVLKKERITFYFDWLEEIYANEDNAKSLQVLKLRNLLESFYEEIGSDFKESFPNLYSRFTYTNEYYSIDNDLQANLNGIRIFLNKVIHNEIKDFSANRIKSCFFYLYNLITLFTEMRVEYFEAEFATLETETFTKIKKSSHTQVSTLSLIVDSWELIQQEDKSFKSEIIGFDEDSEEQIKILVWDLKESSNNNDNYVYGKKIGSIAKLVWKGCNLTFYNIKQNSSDTSVYFTQSNTKIILEADFLLDATSVAKCFQNNSSYHKITIISLFDKVGISVPIVTGNFVNQMLDVMIASGNRDFTSIFKDCVHSSILTSLSLGVKNLLDIMTSIKRLSLPESPKLM